MAKLTFQKGTGRLATDRYDFQDHVDGYNFRHNAPQIDLIPAIIINSVSYSNVYDALNALSGGSVGGAGADFIVVGDGYDTYHNRDITPSTPWDSSIPAFDPFLNDLLNNTANPNHHRISNGGIIVIKAGTYIFNHTVNVPFGISIWGEGYGTKIINQTSSPLPLFKVMTDTNRTPDYGSNQTNPFMFARDTQLFNIVIADNFVEPRFAGDVNYLLPKNADSATPLVSVQEGVNFTAEYVRFIGKTTFSGSTLTSVTSFAVREDHSTPISTGTIVNVKNCFIDGFSTAVETTSLGGTNDHFVFEDNYVRTYGFLNSDLIQPQNNAILKATGTNISVKNNYIYGYNTNTSGVLYISALVSGSPVLEALSRITVSNNNIAVAKSSGLAIGLAYLLYSTTITGADIASKVTSLVYDNNFNNKTEFALNINSTSPQFAVSNYGTLINTRLSYNVSTVSTPTYAIDATTNGDLILLVDTTAARTLTLPTPAFGRTLTIKDKTGQASINHITINRNATDTIDGATSLVINVNYASFSFVSDGTNWFIV